MLRLSHCALHLLLCITAFCAAVCAQSQKTITIRMLDGHTGKLIATSNLLVRVDHQPEGHADWFAHNDDGTSRITLPPGATLLSIRATYDSGTSYYVNCDASKDQGTSEHAAALDHWYKISEILSAGLIAPNNCIGAKIPGRLQVYANPGEFVFFVRKQNWREEMKEDYSSQ
jgi:hypothetical protein